MDVAAARESMSSPAGALLKKSASFLSVTGNFVDHHADVALKRRAGRMPRSGHTLKSFLLGSLGGNFLTLVCISMLLVLAGALSWVPTPRSLSYTTSARTSSSSRPSASSE